jgi:inosine-uridine nucleoside N-ribohydrolase
VDPEAARIVFESGVRLAMVPLEVTHTALVTTSVLQRVRTHQPSPFLQLITNLLMYFADTYLTGGFMGCWGGEGASRQPWPGWWDPPHPEQGASSR